MNQHREEHEIESDGDGMATPPFEESVPPQERKSRIPRNGVGNYDAPVGFVPRFTGGQLKTRNSRDREAEKEGTYFSPSNPSGGAVGGAQVAARSRSVTVAQRDRERFFNFQ
jgi:hypothetical protein